MDPREEFKHWATDRSIDRIEETSELVSQKPTTMASLLSSERKGQEENTRAQHVLDYCRWSVAAQWKYHSRREAVTAPITAPSRRNAKEIRRRFFLPSTHWRSSSEGDPEVETEQDTEQRLQWGQLVDGENPARACLLYMCSPSTLT